MAESELGSSSNGQEADSEPGPQASSAFVNLIGRLAIPVLIFVYSFSFLQSARDLPPISATFPRVMIVALLALTVAAAGQEIYSWIRAARKDRDTDQKERLRTKAAIDDGPAKNVVNLLLEWKAAIGVGVLLAAFFLTFTVIGFYLAAALFLVISMYWLGFRSLWKLLLISSATLAIFYVLFSAVLNLRLPGL